MNTPAYVLAAGVSVWGFLIVAALGGNNPDCNEVKPNKNYIVAGVTVKALKRTGAWGDQCNYWVTDGKKEFVVNVLNMSKPSTR